MLRAGNAPYVIAFLYDQFKRSGAIAHPQSELRQALAAFQEDVQKSTPDALRELPDTYLQDWSSPEKKWLHRFLESGRDEPVYQLTPQSEDVIEFVDRTLHRQMGFVGTESRLRLVISSLQDLVVGSSEEPEVHLDELRRRKEEIEIQIQQIESAGEAPTYQPTRIREQFGLAVSMLKELQRDFRSVEDRFRQIALQVQRDQLSNRKSRGDILGQVLDAEDALRDNDQAVSFYEFFRLIQSSERQQKLRQIIRDLGKVAELSQQADGLQEVRRMMPLLMSEAAKVTETERRLTSTLRRLLNVEATEERQHVASVLADIKAMAASMAGNPPINDVAIEIDSSVSLQSPVSRAFWVKPQEFESVDLTESRVSEEQRQLFQEFAELHRIDFKGMRSSIRASVSSGTAVTLTELLENHPPQSGVMDVIGYLQIAEEDGHLIDEDLPQTISIPSATTPGATLQVIVPLIKFLEQ